ncbi:cyclopropane-fatty-acyl-phospholipid synthase [Desulfotomaculum arcticum]|uniref:Cyclopropane-fatty-acyl-phospholipid synthase n=1 Tax=Desulfotruncus arcticus DSM 17038 TaxID=1121424 RepID=A0A1I2PA34_9FIRM|nr:cyclopropane-fatty-acyl-phospholipid synthase family protein [Desulfotruncus arcticus]SFG13012.1 cyclopropane-fatty-acyl-phospholipid synthase [Desulfotomaculum arcticum] [Desulfotruncus arcticus DSM 17038]
MRKQLLKALFEKASEGDFEVKYWDGEEVRYGTGIPRAKLVFHKPLPLTFNLDDPVLSFGEAYMDEIIDFEGSLEEIIRIAELNKSNLNDHGLKGKAFSAVKTLCGAAARLKQKQNIQRHYDLGNDFFSLWLDETMSYSCAYFKTPQDSLYQAQLQKIDHILKKMQLQPGERLLDIGSGWGWLIIRAARQYSVQALGITISEEQFRATKERIAQLGLSDRVEVKLLDYLDLDENEYQFDKIVSVGMFEHVGKQNMPVYMEKINKLLVPGGLSMLHTISGVDEHPVNSWIDTYIFPGGYIPSLRETVSLLPEYDFHTLHLESLRMHYAMTLDRWFENFHGRLAAIEQKFGRRFVRMWGLYLRSCAASFRVSGLDVYQLLFSKGLNNSLQLTLEHIYA